MNEQLGNLYSIFKLLAIFCLLLFSVTFYSLDSRDQSNQIIEDYGWYGTVGPIEMNPKPSNDTTYILTLKGKALFEENCKTCHSIHERKVGPRLKEISKRKDIKWIRNFVRNPQKIIKQKDPYALKLYKEYDEIMMTSFPELKDEEIDAIISYINDECHRIQ